MSAVMRLEEAEQLAGEWARDMAYRWRQTYRTAGCPPSYLADDTLSLAQAIVEDATGLNALVQSWQRQHGSPEQRKVAQEFFGTFVSVHRELEQLGLEAIDRLCERLAGAEVVVHAS